MRLKSFEARPGVANSVDTVIEACLRHRQPVANAQLIAFNLPPISGLSINGGLQYELENTAGAPLAQMQAVLNGLLVAANQDARLGPRVHHL